MNKVPAQQPLTMKEETKVKSKFDLMKDSDEEMQVVDQRFNDSDFVSVKQKNNGPVPSVKQQAPVAIKSAIDNQPT